MSSHLSPFTFHLSPGGAADRRGGFTLLEILLALALMLVVLVPVIFSFKNSLQYTSQGRARAEAQMAARAAMDTLAGSLGQALEVYVYNDPTVCAFVMPQANTVPPSPQSTIVRYWQIWRGTRPLPNGVDHVFPTYSPMQPLPASLGNHSWYEKDQAYAAYQANPNGNQPVNQATDDDTDTRFIARTEFQTTNPHAAAYPFYLWGIGDPNAGDPNVNARAFPPTSGNLSDPNVNAQFVSLTPTSSSLDVPVLRFTLIRDSVGGSPALLRISLDVSKRDDWSGQPQDVHLERTVELKNVVH